MLQSEGLEVYWKTKTFKSVVLCRQQKSRGLWKKMARTSRAGRSFASSELGEETGDNRNQVSQPFAIRGSFSRPCIPPSGREWAQPQLLPKQHGVFPCTRSWLSLQELPGLSGTAGAAPQHRHSPRALGLPSCNQANATFLLPSSYITLPVGNDTADWWSRSRHPNSNY